MIVATPAHRFVLAVSGLAIEARIASGPAVRTIAGGGNVAQLSSAMEAAIAQGAVGIISFGIAGGLRDDLRPGTWLVACDIVTPTMRWRVDPTWSRALCQRLPAAIAGDLAGAGAIVGSPLDKRELHRLTGAAAVDTESHIAASMAAAHGLPFAAFRVIADPARRWLPPAAALGMQSDGRINRRAVFGSLVRKPHQLPGLLRTAVDARAALRALSHGRRLLGLGLGYPNLDELLLDVA